MGKHRPPHPTTKLTCGWYDCCRNGLAAAAAATAPPCVCVVAYDWAIDDGTAAVLRGCWNGPADWIMASNCSSSLASLAFSEVRLASAELASGSASGLTVALVSPSPVAVAGSAVAVVSVDGLTTGGLSAAPTGDSVDAAAAADADAAVEAGFFSACAHDAKRTPVL